MTFFIKEVILLLVLKVILIQYKNQVIVHYCWF